MATRRATISTASAARLWVLAHRAIWLRLFPIRETWRVRSRSTSAAGTDQVRVRAIARRISAESGTPAAFALARQSADSSGVRRTATKTGRRLAIGMRRQGANGGDAPARAIHRSAGQLGIEGAESLASPRVIPGVCWLPGISGQNRPRERGILGCRNRHNLQSGDRFRRCQPRRKRRCPKGSSVVPEADRPPPSPPLSASLRGSVTADRSGFTRGRVEPLEPSGTAPCP